jgi:hypothetical protein
MMRSAQVLALFAGVGLCGCGALDPFPTVPRPPEPGAAPGQRVGICYNGLNTSLSEAQRQAQQECAANTIAEPADSDWYMQACPLLVPTRATFLCAPRK